MLISHITIRQRYALTAKFYIYYTRLIIQSADKDITIPRSYKKISTLVYIHILYTELSWQTSIPRARREQYTYTTMIANHWISTKVRSLPMYSSPRAHAREIIEPGEFERSSFIGALFYSSTPPYPPSHTHAGNPPRDLWSNITRILVAPW